jgi:predicted secreted protein
VFIGQQLQAFVTAAHVTSQEGQKTAADFKLQVLPFILHVVGGLLQNTANGHFHSGDRMSKKAMTVHRATLALVAALAASGAAAQVPPPVSGVLNLTTTASVEVTKDVLGIVFSTTRDGADAQAVQSALKQALDAALAEAKKIAKPGQAEVQTGNFSLYPRYSNPSNPKASGQPSIIGWQGTAELQVQGKDAAAIAQLSGRVTTMSIARVGYTLSKEAREKVEAEVTARAIADWRAKAQQMSQQFGYGGYTVREVNVATNEQGGGPVPMMMSRVKAMTAANEALPTEAGKGDVTATVSGSALMMK